MNAVLSRTTGEASSPSLPDAEDRDTKTSNYKSNI